MIRAAALIEEARRWLGTPWMHQGRLLGAGVDCVGLPVLALRGCGAVPPGGLGEFDRCDYARNPRGLSLREAIARNCMPCSIPAPGTLLLLRMGSSLRHVAICAGETIIHADHHRGVVEVGYRHPWTTRTDSIWALPGIDYRRVMEPDDE